MTTEEKHKINPKECSVGDMVGMKFKYYVQTKQTMDIREINGIIIEKNINGGLKLLITYDTHGRIGKHGYYSYNWLISRFKGDSLWRVV